MTCNCQMFSQQVILCNISDQQSQAGSIPRSPRRRIITLMSKLSSIVLPIDSHKNKTTAALLCSKAGFKSE